jgi:hypothetical protein
MLLKNCFEIRTALPLRQLVMISFCCLLQDYDLGLLQGFKRNMRSSSKDRGAASNQRATSDVGTIGTAGGTIEICKTKHGSLKFCHVSNPLLKAVKVCSTQDFMNFY